MRLIILALSVFISQGAIAEEQFPEHMQGEWEVIRLDEKSNRYDYVYLRLENDYGYMQMSFGLEPKSQDRCSFSLKSKPLAKDIYNIKLDECLKMNPKRHQGSAIILIPGMPGEMEFKRVDYGSKGYRNDLFSTVLFKVQEKNNLKDRLEKLRASRTEIINKQGQ